MAIVGFEFHKISAEKKRGGSVKNIGHNVKITKAEGEDLNLGTDKQSCVRFTFESKTAYDGLGNIELEGSILYMAKDSEAKEIVAEWKKDKKIKKPLLASIYNKILSKSMMTTLQLSDSIGLPPPMQMPRVKLEKNK